MAKLIDKDAVMNTLRKIQVIQSMNIVQEVAFAEGVDAAIAVVDVSPTVDAVEVVRCKDCKHCAVDKYVKRTFCVLNGEVKPNGHIWFGVAVSEDHYCSHGVRKEKKDAVD